MMLMILSSSTSRLCKAFKSALFSFACLALMAIMCVAYSISWLIKNILFQRRPKNEASAPRSQDKRLVVISGADSGMGRSLVEFLVSQEQHSTNNYQILALCLTEQAVQDLNRQASKGLTAKRCDLTSVADVERIQKYVSTLLEDNNSDDDHLFLYSLINCAGIADPGDFLWDKSLETCERTMDVNYYGTLRITQALLPTMVFQQKKNNKQGGRRQAAKIINITSVNGVVSVAGNSAYCASKFAVEGWSSALRKELKEFGIDVVCVRPGAFKTPMMHGARERISKNFKSANPDIQQLYGGEEYLDKWWSILDRATAAAQSPDIVVSLLYEILETKNPNPVYWAGIDANLLFRSLHALPEAVVDFVLGCLMDLKPLKANKICEKVA